MRDTSAAGQTLVKRGFRYIQQDPVDFDFFEVEVEVEVEVGNGSQPLRYASVSGQSHEAMAMPSTLGLNKNC